MWMVHSNKWEYSAVRKWEGWSERGPHSMFTKQSILSRSDKRKERDIEVWAWQPVGRQVDGGQWKLWAS